MYRHLLSKVGKILRLLFARICPQKGVNATLGTKNSEGLYKTYCPLLFICVSGSRYALIRANAHDKTILFLAQA